MAHAEKPPAAFAADSERLDQQIFQRLARLEPVAKLHRLLAQLDVGHRLIRRLQGTDCLDPCLQLADISGVGSAEDRRDASFEAVHQASHEVADAVPSSL